MLRHFIIFAHTSMQYVQQLSHFAAFARSQCDSGSSQQESVLFEKKIFSPKYVDAVMLILIELRPNTSRVKSNAKRRRRQSPTNSFFFVRSRKRNRENYSFDATEKSQNGKYLSQQRQIRTITNWTLSDQCTWQLVCICNTMSMRSIPMKLSSFKQTDGHSVSYT